MADDYHYGKMRDLIVRVFDLDESLGREQAYQFGFFAGYNGYGYISGFFRNGDLNREYYIGWQRGIEHAMNVKRAREA